MSSNCGCHKKIGSMGKLSGINMMDLAGYAIGATLVQVSNKMIGEVVKPSNDAKKDRTKGILVGIGKGVIGYGIYKYAKKPFGKNVGAGVIGAALYEVIPFVTTVGASPYAEGQKIAGIGASMGRRVSVLDMSSPYVQVRQDHQVHGVNNFESGVYGASNRQYNAVAACPIS
jgi:hypothetical protein